MAIKEERDNARKQGIKDYLSTMVIASEFIEKLMTDSAHKEENSCLSLDSQSIEYIYHCDGFIRAVYKHSNGRLYELTCKKQK